MRACSLLTTPSPPLCLHPAAHTKQASRHMPHPTPKPQGAANQRLPPSLHLLTLERSLLLAGAGHASVQRWENKRRLSTVLRGADSCTKHMAKLWEWSNQTQPQWSRHARRARETGPGSRPLPEGIEVCCRAERCNAGACCWPAPWPASPAAGTLVRQCEQPVQCKAPEQAVGSEAAQ